MNLTTIAIGYPDRHIVVTDETLSEIEALHAAAHAQGPTINYQGPYDASFEYLARATALGRSLVAEIRHLRADLVALDRGLVPDAAIDEPGVTVRVHVTDKMLKSADDDQHDAQLTIGAWALNKARKLRAAVTEPAPSDNKA